MRTHLLLRFLVLSAVLLGLLPVSGFAQKPEPHKAPPPPPPTILGLYRYTGGGSGITGWHEFSATSTVDLSGYRGDVDTPLILCVATPVAGVTLTFSGVNTNGAWMLAEYGGPGGVMKTLSATDGTSLSGATYGKNGSFTWAIPSDWTAASFVQMWGGSSPPVSNPTGYWVRLTHHNGNFSAGTTLTGVTL